MPVDPKARTFIRASRTNACAALTDAASVAAVHATGMQFKPFAMGS